MAQGRKTIQPQEYQMNKLRLEKQGDRFVILDEFKDCAVGYIRPEYPGYKVLDYYSDQIAAVRSVDDAVAALAAHLKANPPRWKDDSAGGHIKLTHEYCDSLEVEKTQDHCWTALRNGCVL